jgi:ParB/RepB/Spo0J family partition protein
MSDLKTVSLDQVRANKVALRQVDRTSEAYLGLVDSIKNTGFSGAITARFREDSETGEPFYEIVDGLHRFSACKDAGVPEIGIDVVDLDDDEVLVAQILANVHKVETKPAEYAENLKRILGRHSMMTEAELASKLGKSPNWIKSILGLNKIKDEQIKALVNSGKVPLMSAYALAKLPEDEQAAFLDRAMTMKPKEFVPLANDRVKEIKDARREGRKANPPTFEPRALLKKLKDIQAAANDRDFLTKLVTSNGVTDPVDAGVLVLQWVQHLDPSGRQAQTDKHEESKRRREAAKEKKKQEKAAAKEREKKAKEDEAAREAAEAHARALAGGDE